MIINSEGREIKDSLGIKKVHFVLLVAYQLLPLFTGNQWRSHLPELIPILRK